MKLFCECTMPDVEVDYEAYTDSCIQYQDSGLAFCPECSDYCWFNPQYENMMFDLRSMNTIW